ncbi:hypothetical protein Pla163_25740 [Planctomycetes bacterium Pla163]|uniref:Glycosyltransferase RgtA/B/C/D-like domain-containing protein n=1 Tax=Rohdeia mirabilis TaxID=2528008 RepID=A0A518D1U3_9BACT|nr:hypothetical protein Pla163_25740 [Planctomycetes bacterium Pla163]
MQTAERDPAATLAARDAAVALILGAAAFALYAATRQWRIYGDGPALLSSLTHDPHGNWGWIHVAFMPVARFWNGAFDWSTPAEALRFLAATGGAVTVATTYLIARCFGARTTSAALVAALLAVTPALWFYSTTIEVHSVHAATIGLLAVATFLAPWHRPALALALVAVLLPLLHLTHQSGATLHLVWILLVRAAWSRRTGRVVTWRTTALVVAPVMTVSLVAALLLSEHLRAEPDFVGASDVGAFITQSRVELTGWRLAGLWGWPIGWLWLALVPALLAPRARRSSGLVALVAAAPLVAFFTWLGVPERGAYSLGFLPFVAAFVASGADEFVERFGANRPALGRVATVAGVLLVALQAWHGVASNAQVDDGSWRARSDARGAFVRALADGPISLVSINRAGQLVETSEPTIREVDLLARLTGAQRAGVPIAVLEEQIVLVLESLRTALDSTVVVDLGHRAHLDDAPELAEILPALEERIEATYTVTEHDHDGRLYWVLEGRRP